MSTITGTSFVTTETRVKKEKKASTSTFWEGIEYSRYGITPMLILLVVCLSGIAAATVGSSVGQLFTVALSTVLALAMIISIAPMKVIAAFSAVTLIIDLTLIVLYFI
jgi:hypothetical protein